MDMNRVTKRMNQRDVKRVLDYIAENYQPATRSPAGNVFTPHVSAVMATDKSNSRRPVIGVTIVSKTWSEERLREIIIKAQNHQSK